jgi:hypothetical protein
MRAGACSGRCGWAPNSMERMEGRLERSGAELYFVESGDPETGDPGAAMRLFPGQRVQALDLADRPILVVRMRNGACELRADPQNGSLKVQLPLRVRLLP